MAIKFLCPNGHPLSCGDDRAGKPGKCPKCGTQFIVPDAEEIAAAASNGSRTVDNASITIGAASGSVGSVVSVGSGKSTAVTPGSGSGLGSAGGLPADQIVFLCPNGHRLNGPKSLQGKPGQCPHCGEKFRIPVYEEEPFEEEIEEFPAEEAPEEFEIPVGRAVDVEPTEDLDTIETFPEEVEIVGPGDLPTIVTATAPISPLPPGPSNQLFDVFSRLWALKPDGTPVELRLKDGQTLRPTKFSPALSRQSFGVFAFAEPDGSFRVLTIPWDTVAQIEFQRLSELPLGMFS